MAAKDELKRYLQEHLAYEREMLGHTYRKLYVEIDQLDWNAFFESFGVHARNLYNFLRNAGKSNTRKAKDYVDKWKAPAFLSQFNKLEESFFHLSTTRSTERQVRREEAHVMGEWIDREWSQWVSALDTEFQLVSSDAVCIEPATVGVVGPPSATNRSQSLLSITAAPPAPSEVFTVRTNSEKR